MNFEREIEKTISSIRPGEHLCCLYDSEPQHRETVTAFLRDGLEQGQKLVYVYDAHSPQAILDYFRTGLDSALPGPAAGLVDLDSTWEDALARGQLVFLPCEQVYLRDGVFDPQHLFPLIEEQLAQARAEGYPALRMTGETSWIDRSGSSLEQVLEYETLLDCLPESSQCIFLCQYDRRCFSPAQLIRVLQAHPLIISGRYVYDNFYYLPPEALLGPDPSSARLQQWLENLAGRQQAEWQLENARRRLASRVEAQSARLVDANRQIHTEVSQRLGMEYALVQANAALRETENRYKSVFDAAPDAMYIQDLYGRFIEVNEAACQRFGYSRTELLEMSPLQVIAPEFHAKVAERIEYLCASDDALSFDLVYCCRDGRRLHAEVSSRRISYDGGYAIFSSARDITERKQAEAALRQSEANLHAREEDLRRSEAQFRSLVEHLPMGIALTNERGIMIEWNACAQEIYRIPAAQVLGRPIWEVVLETVSGDLPPAEQRERLRELMESFFRTGEAPWLYRPEEHQLTFADGQVRRISRVCFPIRTESGFILAVMIHDQTDAVLAEEELQRYRQRLELMVEERTVELNERSVELQMRTAELQHEVKERQQVESVLRESEGRYRALVNQSPLSILVVQDDRYVFANQAIVERLGYSSSYDLVGRAVTDTLMPESFQAPHTGSGQARAGELGEPAIITYLRRDGRTYISENSSAPIFYQGRPAMLVFGQDVSERIRYEQQLEASLSEKEVMLREIHHRVKNNLNVIIALIDLQKATQNDPQVLEVFKELQTRAYTMSLVHESLYRSPNLAKIEFSRYLQTLIDYLYSAYGPAIGAPGLSPVHFEVEAADVSLKIETAIPCGLIVNELVTNALKYAFPPGAACQEDGSCMIAVRLERLAQVDSREKLAGEQLALTVRDNGVGLPQGLDWKNAPSLGLQLVQVLSRQLGGQVELESDHGLSWRLVFIDQR